MSLSVSENIAALPPLRDVIETHNLRPTKALGQNFLLDLNVTDKIVRLAGDVAGKTVVEIGPGPGGLTRSILAAGAEKVYAIEFDKRAHAALQGLQAAADGRLELIQADALTVDIPALTGGKPCAIIANLPYNIATPLLIRWLGDIHAQPEIYEFMALMFQKEVGQRLDAAVGAPQYGRLAVISQWLCHVDKLYDLPAEAFTPPPKVLSRVVRLVPKVAADRSVPFPDMAVMEELTKKAFGMRRKMIRSSLKPYRDVLDELGIDQTLRAENIDVALFEKIAQALSAAS